MTEQRFLVSSRETVANSGDDPGMVLGDDGIVYVIEPDGDRTPVSSDAQLDEEVAARIAGDAATLAAAVRLSEIHAKGDLLAGTGTGAVVRVPVGADGSRLVADATQPGGLRYDPLTYPGGAPGLKGAKFVPIVGSNLPIGNNDLYTVPAGRKALVDRIFLAYNIAGSGGNIVSFAQIKVGGVYYRTTANVTNVDGASTNFMSTGIQMVLGPGETVAMNTATTAGLNIRGGAWEFDADEARMFTARILGLATGNNTLYTCPPGKTTGFVQGATFNVSMASNIVVVNSTGGALLYAVNVVPSGQTPALTNRIVAATSINDKASASLLGAEVLGPGDSLVVNASGPDAGSHHIAWATGYVLP